MAEPALDAFLEELHQLQPLPDQTLTDAVWALTTAFFAQNGFDKLIFIDSNPDRMVLLSTLPTAWIDRYHAENYAKIDPFFQHCGTTFRPISTGVAYSDTHDGLTQAQHNLIAEAAEFGINAGFSSTVRLFGPTGFAGWNIGSSLSGKDVDRLRLDREVTMRFAARQAHDLLCQTEAGPSDRILSTREWQCLMLLAKGHRTKQIAWHLSISAAAVELYVRNARTKLGASTREQAIAIATAQGLLVGA